MRVFISWSGDESRQIAAALREWLPMVVQAAEVYMSANDNESGARWAEAVGSELQASNVGILCLTPENLDSRWLHFEAGALSKSIEHSRVVPLLHRLRPADIRQPLAQFHAKPTTREGILAVAEMVNRQADKPLEAQVLTRTFELSWPSLEQQLGAINSPAPTAEVPERSERDLLEEILQILRADSHRTASDWSEGRVMSLPGGERDVGPLVYASEAHLRSEARRIVEEGLGKSAGIVFLPKGRLILRAEYPAAEDVLAARDHLVALGYKVSVSKSDTRPPSVG